MPQWCMKAAKRSSETPPVVSSSSMDSLETVTAEKSASPLATEDTPKTTPRSNTVPNSSEINTIPRSTHRESADEILSLPLQAVKLTPEDCIKPDIDTDSTLLAKLNLPTKIPSADGKWLALKLLQLKADIALVRYKYLKSYTKINKLVMKYFSKPDISETQEAKGYHAIDHEMTKFKHLENVLTLLTTMQDHFYQRFAPGHNQEEEQNTSSHTSPETPTSTTV